VRRFNVIIHNLLAQGIPAQAHRSEEHTPGASRVPPPFTFISLLKKRRAILTRF
jgi:hypothetical protein